MVSPTGFAALQYAQTKTATAPAQGPSAQLGGAAGLGVRDRPFFVNLTSRCTPPTSGVRREAGEIPARSPPL